MFSLFKNMHIIACVSDYTLINAYRRNYYTYNHSMLKSVKHHHKLPPKIRGMKILKQNKIKITVMKNLNISK